MKKILFVFLSAVIFFTAGAQEVMPLYEGRIPNSIDGPNLEANVQKPNPQRLTVQKVSRPTLQLFKAPAKKANGTSVIICPGGAYTFLSYEYEGTNIAKKFNDIGVTAFILKYRLPDSNTMVDKSFGPMEDLQQAIKIVREGAGKWDINPDKIGVVGFSAGGHLAATGGTHFNDIMITNASGTSLRPDFLILVYPVISMTDSLTHKGSRYNLLGAYPTQQNVNYFSNELHVTNRTPPTLLLQAGDDKVVTVQNSLCFYQALLEKSVPVEMHLYQSGDHGFLKNKGVIDHWFSDVASWMRRDNLIK